MEMPKPGVNRVPRVLAVIVIGGIAVGLWLRHDRTEASAGRRLRLFGNIDIRQVQLAFNDNERIASMLVQEGEHVRPGQLLATLDTRRLEAVVGNDKAKAAAQHQVVTRLLAGNRPQEIRKAAADLAVAQAELRDAQVGFDRVSRLVAQKVNPLQELDDARATLDVAKAKVSAARETYELMVLGPRQEDIAAAQATLQANEAELVLAERVLADARLYAPTNGVIEDRLLEPGDMASPQQPVFTLALDDPVWVRAYVSETDLGRLRPGMPAEVTTDTFPGKRYPAWVGFISPTAEFTPKTVETAEVRTHLVYQVRVFVRNPQGELRLGMPAAVTIPLNQGRMDGAARRGTGPPDRSRGRPNTAP